VRPRLLALLVMALIGQAGCGEPDAAMVGREIDARGARVVVQDLWSNDRYETVLQRADAAASEGLTFALAEALPRNATAVLSVLDPRRTALAPTRVCGVPFIEGTAINVADYVRSAEKAVNAVGEPQLNVQRTSCLMALQSS
jgi:hypothetical protein